MNTYFETDDSNKEQSYLMKKLIDEYHKVEPFNGQEEEYKWELLDKTEGKDTLSIIKNLRGENIIYNAHVDDVLKKLWETKEEELVAIVNHLYDETKPIDERIATFKAEMRSICPSEWKNCANDERTASALLMCKYPDKYTTYKDEIYQLICKYFGIESRQTGLKFCHFTEIINKIADEYGEEIQESMLPQISKFRNKPLNLAIQTLFWVMKEGIKTDFKKDSIIENKNMQEQEKYKEYIELLKENHNLVLTGAPGTGKTFMAQAIAKEMGAETKFVQFHPSYDYTDFVEGLRPIVKEDGQMGFERKDGVFKEFCKCATDAPKAQIKKAIPQFVPHTNIKNSDFWTVYNSIVDDIKTGKIASYQTQYKTQKLSVRKNRVVFRADNSPRFEKEENIKLLYDYFINHNKYDLSNVGREELWALITELTHGRTKTIDPSEYKWILQEMLNRSKYIINKGNNIVTHPDIIPQEDIIEKDEVEEQSRPYVFIIDEINRGEASKIFGELFYAIDPGYRGKKDHLVQTQYQNLVSEDDVFADGFYVPENVYILATMNDIDRSVESMDFAMRRRFTWKEVTPTDTEYMLDNLVCADEAKTTMQRLNKAIEETNELGPAYMIGPAYFLKLGENGSDFKKLWNMNIEPLLKEYLRGFRNSTTILNKFKETYFELNNSDTPNSDD